MQQKKGHRKSAPQFVQARSDRSVEGLAALLPVAGDEFVGLQRVEDSQDFFDIAADGQVVNCQPADDAVRGDQEDTAISDSGIFDQNAIVA